MDAGSAATFASYHLLHCYTATLILLLNHGEQKIWELISGGRAGSLSTTFASFYHHPPSSQELRSDHLKRKQYCKKKLIRTTLIRWTLLHLHRFNFIICYITTLLLLLHHIHFLSQISSLHSLFAKVYLFLECIIINYIKSLALFLFWTLCYSTNSTNSNKFK